MQRALARLLPVLALLTFPLSLASLFSFALTPNLLHCDAFSIAVVLCAFLGVGGHFLLALMVAGTVYSNEWPRLKAALFPASSSAAQFADGSLNYELLPSSKEEALQQPTAPAQSLTARRLSACALAVTLLGMLCTWGLALGALLLVRSTVSPRTGRTGLPLAYPVSLSYSPEGLSHVSVQSPPTSGNGTSSEHALWYGQGWSHARARLWQMEFQRRVGAGRLSEAVGEAGLSVDRAMRVLGVYAAAQRDYAGLATGSPERAALEAYAQGVNAFTAAATPAYLPLEFRVLGLAAVEPWSPADSLVWQKLMAWDLCGNFDLELQRFEMAYLQGVPPGRVGQLLPAFDHSAFPTILTLEELSTGQDPPQAPVGPAAQPPPAFPPESSPTGRVQELVEAARAGRSSSSSSSSSSSEAARPAPPALSRLQQAVASLASLVRLAVLGNSSSSRPLGHTAPPVRASRLRVRGGGGASNAWVANGTQSPIVANDPHLQLLAPSLWYLQRLTDPASGIDVQGVSFESKSRVACQPHAHTRTLTLSPPPPPTPPTQAAFPGLPGIVIGRNRRIAWGVTNTGVDTQDLYVLNATASAYMYDGVAVPFTTRTETIHVKGASPVTLTVRSTPHHGVVVSDCSELVGGRVAASGVALALRWVSTDPSTPDTTFGAFYGLQRAADWAGFRAALSQWVSPSQNVVFASTAAGGDFGYQMPGHIPVRDRSSAATVNNSGAWPVPGDSSAYAWLPQPWAYDSLPRALNPAKGYVATANNPAVPEGWPYFLTADWDCGGEGYRAARISQQLALQGARPEGHTVGSTAALQTDSLSLFALALCELLTAARVVPATPGGAALAARLAAWDKSMALGSTLAPQFADVWARVSVLGAGQGSSGESSVWTDPQFLLAALASEADPACAEAGHASCAAFAASALDASAAHFESLQAAALPQWGVDLHLARAEHEVLHGSALGCLGDRSVGHGGDAYTVNVGGFELQDSARTQTHGPSVRHILAGQGSRWVQPMGQEGDLLSTDYDSLLEMWAQGEYLQMEWEGGVKQALTLGP